MKAVLFAVALAAFPVVAGADPITEGHEFVAKDECKPIPGSKMALCPVAGAPKCFVTSDYGHSWETLLQKSGWQRLFNGPSFLGQYGPTQSKILSKTGKEQPGEIGLVVTHYAINGSICVEGALIFAGEAL